MASLPSKLTNSEFRSKLIRLVVRDHTFMRDVGGILVDQAIFEPEDGESQALYQIAGLSLEHWFKYNETIGPLLKGEIAAEVKLNRWKGQMLEDLRTITRSIFNEDPTGAEYIKDNLMEFRQRAAREDAMKTMIELHELGTLDDEKFMAICRETVAQFAGHNRPSTDMYDDDQMENRVVRRAMDGYNKRWHKFFIAPLDRITKGIGRGHLGLILSPYKRGKSMMLLWLAAVLTIQGYNVAYFTLEDPLQDVEDRMDSLMSSVTSSDLAHMPEEFRKGWKNWRRNAAGKGSLRIIDLRDIEAKVETIEAEYERLRGDGFLADAVIIDYDNLLVPEKRQATRKEELTSLYRELVRWTAKRNVLLWIASQTDANSDEVQKLSGRDLADDKGKLRHVTMALGLGAPGENWPENSIYFYVAAHRNAPMHMGCHVIPDKEKTRIYDPIKTSEEAAKISDLPAPEAGADEQAKRQSKGFKNKTGRTWGTS